MLNLFSLFRKKPEEQDVAFVPYSDDVTSTPPLPLRDVIPEYFKKCPRKFSDHPADLTYKACPSFVDAFTVGYVLRTPVDIYIKANENGFEWKTPPGSPGHTVSFHSSQQIQSGTEFTPLNPEDYYGSVLKIDTGYLVKNNPEVSWQILPFFYDKEGQSKYTAFYGYFDNMFMDRYGTCPINMAIRNRGEESEFLIRKGTPIAIMVPYVRTKFKSKVLPPDPDRAGYCMGPGVVKARGVFDANSAKVHREKKQFD